MRVPYLLYYKNKQTSSIEPVGIDAATIVHMHIARKEEECIDQQQPKKDSTTGPRISGMLKQT